ncbi:MAG: DUF362 domain-containing protein [Desulfobulbaceae bacterium]|nr:DUF362 domain-containing protein [Desulfobulbaceae bacterium]
MQISEKPQKGTVFSTDYTSWDKSLKILLEKSDLADELKGRQRILIKPNLVEALKPPITTPVALIDSLVDWLREMAPHCSIMIGEGCGSAQYDTWYVFEQLGYTRLAGEKKIDLLDLNEESCVKKENQYYSRFPKIFLPVVLFDCFLLSVPVLKAHSLAGVTLTMKNMMGTAPPEHYQQGGYWKKASFHSGIHEAIFDLNRYRSPDFTILDATVGMSQAHLWGPVCSPAKNKLAAGFDPVAIDAWGCKLLGRDWRKIGHIRLADGVLGAGDFDEVRC